MSYYNLTKENFKFFSDNLKMNEVVEEPIEEVVNETVEEIVEENLTGGDKKMKYNVIDFDWDDIVLTDEDDIFLYSVSKELQENNKPKIKEPPKEEVYDELLNETENDKENENENNITHKLTGELHEIDDEQIEDEEDGVFEDTLADALTNEASNEKNEEASEHDSDEFITDDEIDTDNDEMIDEYFTPNTQNEYSNKNLAEIDDIIQNYFECFENFQGGQNINKIKDILSDENEYKNSLSLTGGNFKPIPKRNINKLYPYSLN